jgi:hypothetical protein
MATPRIFLSYRRGDSGGHTGRLYDWLTARFGRENVFQDLETILLERLVTGSGRPSGPPGGSPSRRYARRSRWSSPTWSARPRSANNWTPRRCARSSPATRRKALLHLDDPRHLR